VQVQVTALPGTATSTAPVHLLTPNQGFTATLVPAMPLPTATATATATPIVYVVQKGDNLLEIAEQYDISVQALIDANGIADPRALQVGQTLIIPPDDASSVVKPPTVTPTPMPLRVVNLAFHYTPVGSLWCMGEVENERDEFLDLVQLRVSLYSVDGTLVDEAADFTAADVVPAHAKAPFAILFSHPPASGFAGYEVTVLSAEPITQWGRRHRALAVEQIDMQMSQGSLEVHGVVHNPSEADAIEVEVILTAYGQANEVVGVRLAAIGDLPAGTSRPLDLAWVPAAPALRVGAVAWGMKANP
jgi:LysM repeat protein